MTASDDLAGLIERLRQNADMLRDGHQKNLTKLWHSEVVRDAAKDADEAADALTSLSARVAEMEGERDGAVTRGLLMLAAEDHWKALADALQAELRKSAVVIQVAKAIVEADGTEEDQTVVRALERIDAALSASPTDDRHPALDWKLSDDAKQRIAEIERNINDAKARGDVLVAHLLQSSLDYCAASEHKNGGRV